MNEAETPSHCAIQLGVVSQYIQSEASVLQRTTNNISHVFHPHNNLEDNASQVVAFVETTFSMPHGGW